MPGEAVGTNPRWEAKDCGPIRRALSKIEYDEGSVGGAFGMRPDAHAAVFQRKSS